MPPRRKKPSGLTEDDVARLRSQLGEGRRPRVALSGPQFETGASGSVVRIGDPAVDGADFLTVRVKVNGVTDELAFAPAELSIGSRTRSGSAGARSAGAGSAGAGSAGGRTRTAQPLKAAAKPAPVNSPAPTSAPPAPTSSGPGTTAAAEGGSPAATDTASGSEGTTRSDGAAPTPVSPPAPAGNAAAGRRRKAPTTPAVSVTISSTGASWSVSASRGARTIAKGVPVAPGVVTAIAELLGQPGFAEAVAEINETARLQAEQRAEQLRAELSDLEAVLATHRTPR